MSYTQFKGNLVTLEETHYYPFGLKHGSYYTSATQKVVKKQVGDINNLLEQADNELKIKPTANTAYKYKYQGQERQDELDLNWDSFKYRNYDYAIGRFMSIDPLAEDYSYQSPYNFAENRVIDGIELEGLEWKSIKDKDGNTNISLTVQLYNDAGLTDKQLTKLKTSITEQFAESYTNEGENVIGKKYIGGRAGALGKTQKNSFEVTAKKDGSRKSNSDVARSFSHEAGHTAGLRHPWSKKQSVSDITQGSASVTAKTIKANLMNSGGNTTKANRSTSGTTVTKGQLKSIDKLIRSQQ
jgi:RHS repeat-associated protein